MKNYLGNLIARHMNMAEVLQPRLASRFEPQSSFLQSEAVEPKAAEVDVADTIRADRAVVANVSPINVETDFESSDPSAVIPNHGIHHDAAAQPAQVKSAANSSPNISLPDIGDEETLSEELTTSTIVASDQPDKSTVSKPTSVSRAPVDETSDSETRSVAPPVLPTSSIGTLSAEPRPNKTPDQVTVVYDTAKQTLRESDPAIQPVISSRRAAISKSNQTVTPATPVELQPPVELQQSVQRTTAETMKETVVLRRESAPATSSVSPFERHRSDPTEPPRPNITAVVHGSPYQLLSAAVVHEPKAKSPVVVTETESKASSNLPERFTEETRPPQLTQRPAPLETSVVTSPRNDPMSPMVSPHDIAPVETGPTINVTIGRIEVRAATTEARPTKERREQQVLSLDEYLSQRSAGGR